MKLVNHSVLKLLQEIRVAIIRERGAYALNVVKDIQKECYPKPVTMAPILTQISELDRLESLLDVFEYSDKGVSQ